MKLHHLDPATAAATSAVVGAAAGATLGLVLMRGRIRRIERLARSLRGSRVRSAGVVHGSAHNRPRLRAVTVHGGQGAPGHGGHTMDSRPPWPHDPVHRGQGV